MFSCALNLAPIPVGHIRSRALQYPPQSAVSSVRSASPASLYWDSPPRFDSGGAPNPGRGWAIAQRSPAGRGAKTGGHHNNNNSNHGDDDDEYDGGGSVDLFYVDRLMSRATAAAAATADGRGGIPPLQQGAPAVISDSGSAFDDGTAVAFAVGSVAGLRRRRGEHGSGRQGGGAQPGTR